MITNNTTFQSIELTSLIPGEHSEEMAAKLKMILKGTYMNLEVVAAPHQGQLIISVQGVVRST